LNGRRDLEFAPDEYAGFTMTLMRMLAFALVDERPKVVEPPRTVPRSNPPENAAGRPQPRNAAPNKPGSESLVPVDGKPARAAFDGNWLALVGRLNAGGMAHMLARHCELGSYQDGKFDLFVPEEHRHLLDRAYQDKLRSAIESNLGVRVRLNFSVGTANANSLAAQEDRAQRETQARAIAAIEQDSFVRELVETLDAKLIESSIRPVQ